MSTFLYIKRVNKNFVFWKKKKFRAYPSLIIINIINMMFNKLQLRRSLQRYINSR